jgi:hypothetical protein
MFSGRAVYVIAPLHVTEILVRFADPLVQGTLSEGSSQAACFSVHLPNLRRPPPHYTSPGSATMRLGPGVSPYAPGSVLDKSGHARVPCSQRSGSMGHDAGAAPRGRSSSAWMTLWARIDVQYQPASAHATRHHRRAGLRGRCRLGSGRTRELTSSHNTSTDLEPPEFQGFGSVHIGLVR